MGPEPYELRYRPFLQEEECMTVLIDADACPVVRLAEEIAARHGIRCILLCDTNHALQSDISEVRTIGAGADAVDFALINLCRKGDVVITQDYGVAAMALGKRAYAIHQSGRQYTDDNIDELLMQRHLTKKARMASHKAHLKGPSKRTAEDDRRFAEGFERLLIIARNSEGENSADGGYTANGDGITDR